VVGIDRLQGLDDVRSIVLLLLDSVQISGDKLSFKPVNKIFFGDVTFHQTWHDSCLRGADPSVNAMRCY
jgi:hypothetical protein